jgi:hypothetical protein
MSTHLGPAREPPAPTGRLGVLIGTTRLRDPTTGEEIYTLDLLDLDSGEAEPARIPLDFFGHGLAFHPKTRQRAALIEKRGRQGCVVDLAERRVVEQFAPMPEHAFYGHAAYSAAGDTLFVVETGLSTKNGVVSIRDSATAATLDVLPTYGMSPHDCRLADDGRTLIITNGGGPRNSAVAPSVTCVDVQTRALVEKLEVHDPVRNAGHVAIGEAREIVLLSAPREGMPASTSLGCISLSRRGEEWTHISPPETVASRLAGEALSVAVHEPSRTALATHPDGDLITFWNLDGRTFAGSLDLPCPRGVAITLDQRFYAVSYGIDARLILIDTRALRPLGSCQLARGALAGAHLYVLAV